MFNIHLETKKKKKKINILKKYIFFLCERYKKIKIWFNKTQIMVKN